MKDVVRRLGQRALQIALIALCATALLSGQAVAAGDFTWSGDGGSELWSDGSNWVGGTAPSGSVGTLSFTASCTTDYCAADDDLPLLKANALVLNDGSEYDLTRDASERLRLGAGGLDATTQATNKYEAVDFAIPITLVASQTWTVDGGPAGDGKLDLVGGARGSATDSLTINVSRGGWLGASLGNLGLITIGGADPSLSGSAAAGNGSVSTTMNTKDANPVVLQHAALLSDSIGPLTVQGGYINLASVVGTLNAMGSVSLDSSSAVGIQIAGPNTTPGQDYSQLTAAGPIDLGGAQLALATPTFPTTCPRVTAGTVDTLVSSAASVSGTFAGIPDGGTVSLDCTGATGPLFRINYTATAVTATALTSTRYQTAVQLTVGPPPWLGGNGTAPSLHTNDPVTLYADIFPTTNVGSKVPSGTVTFRTGGNVLPGCAAVPVGWGQSNAPEASCTTSFGAAGSPVPISATFTPTDPTLWDSSSRSDVVQVLPSPTSTRLTATAVGGSATYTALTTTASTGPLTPNGTIEFLQDGSPIPACDAIPVDPAAGSSVVASCVAPAADGPATVTARYSGDGNFTGSAGTAAAIVAAPQPELSLMTASLSRLKHKLRLRVGFQATPDVGGFTLTLPRGLVFRSTKAVSVTPRSASVRGSRTRRLSVKLRQPASAAQITVMAAALPAQKQLTRHRRHLRLTLTVESAGSSPRRSATFSVRIPKR